MNYMMNVGFVSLGCSKNLLDTEMTIGLFKNNNFNIVNDPSKADIIVVNTCFITALVYKHCQLICCQQKPWLLTAIR